jgi:hypothetical protein
MSIEKNQELILRLISRTARGELDWKEAADRGFQVSFSHNSVKLQSSSSRNGNVYTVLLLNARGEVADSFDDEDLDEQPGGKWFETLKELYRQAQRHVRGADDVLNDLLSELKNGSDLDPS